MHCPWKKHQSWLLCVGIAAPLGWAAFGCLKKHRRQLWKILRSPLGASQSRSWSGSKRTAKGEKGLCLNQSLHATWGSIYMQMQSRSCDVPSGDAAHCSHQDRNKITIPSHSSFLPLLFLSLQWNYVEKELWFNPVLALVSPETPAVDDSEDTVHQAQVFIIVFTQQNICC